MWIVPGCGSRSESIEQPESASSTVPENSSASATSGSLLRIVCDVPEELDYPTRTVRGHVGWSEGNITRGQTFTFELAKPVVELPIDFRFPLNEKIHVRFVVNSGPTTSRFTDGDWFLYTDGREEASRGALSITLSTFLDRSKKYRKMAP